MCIINIYDVNIILMCNMLIAHFEVVLFIKKKKEIENNDFPNSKIYLKMSRILRIDCLVFIVIIFNIRLIK
jgi:hypothetical protein